MKNRKIIILGYLKELGMELIQVIKTMFGLLFLGSIIVIAFNFIAGNLGVGIDIRLFFRMYLVCFIGIIVSWPFLRKVVKESNRGDRH